MTKSIPAAPYYRILKDLVEVCEAAIHAGDWKVDGAADPDWTLLQADKLIKEWDAWREHIQYDC